MAIWSIPCAIHHEMNEVLTTTRACRKVRPMHTMFTGGTRAYWQHSSGSAFY